ncbi:MAG: folate family ECF transporter S component [Lachnospiraceae bacterium]|nr:folate family ECF transporter S component [Lachnospiraceae bacterium]
MSRTKKITVCGMLLALCVLAGALKIPINSYVEIRFSFLSIAIAGYLFGPLYGGIVGALSDILGFIVKPTGAFFPGFTIAQAVTGVLYGLILHPKKQGNELFPAVSFPRIILAQLLVMLTVSMFLNTINLSILYGEGFIPIFISRLARTIVMFPINLVLLSAVLKPVSITGRKILREGAQ